MFIKKMIIFVIYFSCSLFPSAQDDDSWKDLQERVKSYSYYSSQNLHRINKINDEIGKRNKDKAEQGEVLMPYRKKHLPLFIMADPQNFEKDKQYNALRYMLYESFIASWSTPLLVSRSLIKNFIEVDAIQRSVKSIDTFFIKVFKNFIVYVVEETDFLLFMPRWADHFYDMSQCFNQKILVKRENFNELKKDLKAQVIPSKIFYEDIKKIFIFNDLILWDI